jgi:hypothetical protein
VDGRFVVFHRSKQPCPRPFKIMVALIRHKTIDNNQDWWKHEIIGLAVYCDYY